jgi:hypothetical protein
MAYPHYCLWIVQRKHVCQNCAQERCTVNCCAFKKCSRQPSVDGQLVPPTSFTINNSSLTWLPAGHRYIKADFRISGAEAARLRAANLRRLLTARKLLLVLDLDHTLLNSCRCIDWRCSITANMNDIWTYVWMLSTRPACGCMLDVRD